MRKASVKRTTKETDVEVAVDLDGTGASSIATGIGFLDHMLDLLARHSRIDLTIKAKGDLHIDQHHTTEDVGIALGQADVFVNVAGGVRIDEPGADLAIALAIASAARRRPVRARTASFGEIGLTGRLREATQADRRLEECAKLGLMTVLAPSGTPTRGKIRVEQVETLRHAIGAGLDAERAQGADEA